MDPRCGNEIENKDNQEDQTQSKNEFGNKIDMDNDNDKGTKSKGSGKPLKLMLDPERFSIFSNLSDNDTIEKCFHPRLYLG